MECVGEGSGDEDLWGSSFVVDLWGSSLLVVESHALVDQSLVDQSCDDQLPADHELEDQLVCPEFHEACGGGACHEWDDQLGAIQNSWCSGTCGGLDGGGALVTGVSPDA